MVQELLGHSGIAVTMDVYSHVLPTMQQEAMSDMDKLLVPNSPALLLKLLSNQKPRLHFWKPGLILCLDFGSGGWTRTNDLRVMSPTSCHCSTPRRSELSAISDQPSAGLTTCVLSAERFRESETVLVLC